MRQPNFKQEYRGAVIMDRMKIVIFFLGLGLLSFQNALPNTLASSVNARQFELKELSCEYAHNPLGIDTPAPRFSWILESNQRGQMQSAYRILVAGSVEKLDQNVGDKWDSGKVVFDDSVNIVYEGKPLSSAEKCYWKVRVWDKNGKSSPWSEPATFEMGLLQKSDWQSQWIAMSGTEHSLPYVQGKFGQAVHLDGKGQSVEIPHYTGLKPAKQITFSAWIKPRWIGTRWQDIYRKEDGKARQVFALGDYPNNISGLWVGLGIAGRYVEKGAAVDTAVLTDGNWHLATATYDGSTIKLYFDGAEIGSWKQTGSLDTAGTSSGFIGSTGGRSEYFEGGVDDVRIYCRALSAKEIKSMAGGAAVVSDLVGWWKLDGNLKNSTAGKGGRTLAIAISAPLFRKEFTVTKKIKQARMYISGLGWNEFYINGKRVSDHVLDPAMTNYHKHIFYVTHDVTDMLTQGQNAIAVMLGNGWYSEPGRQRYGNFPILLGQLNITFADGSTMNVNTDTSWTASSGPITRNGIQGGETYDARLEKPGWTQAGYDDSRWRPAVITDAPGGELVSQIMPPIKVHQTMKPIKLTHPKPGIYVYDLGQVFMGWARLRVKGTEGAEVIIKYSERIFPDSGLLDKRNHPAPAETDYYILKGDSVGEVYEPRFTFHPFRYVQIENYPGTPTLQDLQGLVVHSAVDTSVLFHCSNPLLNKIHHITFWTIQTALYGMPLDAPHREPFAYLEPAETPSNLYSRRYMPLFWTKWLRDVQDDQNPNGSIPVCVPDYPRSRSLDPAWSGNYPIAVWYVYQYYDDERILADHYESMKRWVDYVTTTADKNHLVFKGTWGDHMLAGVRPGEEQWVSRETPPALCWTGHYYRDASIISQVAKILGRDEDARHYADLAETIKTSINKKWFNPHTNQYAAGSQTSNLFALALDIVPEANQQAVAANVAKNITEKYNGHLHTGIIGTTSMMEALVEHGYDDVMYNLVNRTSYPGWGYMVDQGATTIWESWGRFTKGVGRRAESMAMFATIDEFFYSDLAGIKGPDYYGSGLMAPGFRHIIIQPHVPGDLTGATASMQTVRGRISSSWKRSDNLFTLDVDIPVNSTAKVNVPKIGLSKIVVSEGGTIVWRNNRFIKGVSGIANGAESHDYITFDVGSGHYHLELKGN